MWNQRSRISVSIQNSDSLAYNLNNDAIIHANLEILQVTNVLGQEVPTKQMCRV